MKNVKYLVMGICGLILFTGCTKNIGFGNFDYNYVTCDSDYIKLKNARIKSYQATSSSLGLEITLEDGNVVYVSTEKCYISKNIVE